MIGIRNRSVRRQPTSQRDQRRRRKRDFDDDGDGHVAASPKAPTEKKKKLKPPTNTEQSELLQAALEKGLIARGLKGLALRQEVREWEHIFSRSRARYLHALNPYAGAKWAGFLGQAIENTEFEDTAWKVTIISDDWAFSTYPHGPTERDLRWLLSRMRKETRRGLRGVPYLLQADFAVRRHVADHRTAIEVHWHGLVWATAVQIEALKRRFPANRFGAVRFFARDVYDLAGALRYVTKDTRIGYSTVKNFGFQPGSRHWKAWFQHREALSGPRRLLLLRALGNLTKPELCACSGVGRTVLGAAKRLAKSGGYKRLPVTQQRPAPRRASPGR